MPRWSIYYETNRVEGSSRAEWAHAPNEGVQVVVLHEPIEPHLSPWTGVSDRQLWTGTGSYDPFGWGEKRGSLIADGDYARIWNRAAYGNR